MYLPNEIWTFHIIPKGVHSDILRLVCKAWSIIPPDNRDVVNWASRYGHLEVLKYARQNGCT